MYSFSSKLPKVKTETASFRMNGIRTIVPTHTLTHERMKLTFPLGRRFAGKNHLVSLYNEGRLRNGGVDVELEADVNAFTLRQKRSILTSPANHAHHFPTPNNKRRFPSDVRCDIDVPLKKRTNVDGIPEKRPTNVDATVKRRPSYDDDDDDIVISDDEEAISNAVVKTERLRTESGGSEDTSFNSHEIIPPSDPYPSDGANHRDLYFPLTSASPSLPSLEPSSSSSSTPCDLSWVASEFLVASKKAHVIVNMEGEESFDEVKKKILDSVLYDLAKAAAIRYPPLEPGADVMLAKVHTRQYVHSLFNEWCAHFPHMASLEKLELNYTPEKTMSFKVYMRARLSNAFSSVRHSNRFKGKITASTGK